MKHLDRVVLSNAIPISCAIVSTIFCISRPPFAGELFYCHLRWWISESLCLLLLVLGTALTLFYSTGPVSSENYLFLLHSTASPCIGYVFSSSLAIFNVSNPYNWIHFFRVSLALSNYFVSCVKFWVRLNFKLLWFSISYLRVFKCVIKFEFELFKFVLNSDFSVFWIF